MGKQLLFYFTLFLLILAFSTTAQNFDFDLWARLIAGMGLVEGGHVLKVDFLSYTPTHTWWDHEWGSGVIFYLFVKFFGGYSLIILQAILLFLTFFIISKIIKLRTNLPNNILFFFFGLMAILPNLNSPIRCHMFSFLFFTLFLYILELARKGENRPLYLIPLIIIFWNNVHGGVVSGLGLIIMYIIGEFFDKKDIKKYIITLLASIPLLLINPWGLDYIKFLLMANTMKRPEIIEWWGIFSKYHFYKHLEFKFFMFMSVLIELCTFKKWEKVDKTKVIILLATLYLSITHVKLLPFFVIASMSFIYEDLYELTKNLKLPPWKDKVIYGILLFSSIFCLTVKELTIPLDMKAYPIKEVEFIKQNNIKGKVLVNFGLGSYVSYKLYPNNLIFMDGRYEEVYHDFMVPMMKKFYLVKPGWDEILMKYRPDCMIIEKGYPIYKVLQNSKKWELVYEGDIFGVFVSKENVKNSYTLPPEKLQHYKNTLFDTDIKF